MDSENIRKLIVQLTVIADRLDQRSAFAVQRVEQAAHAMDDGARQLAASTHGFTRDVSQALQQRSGEIVGQGIGGAVERFSQQLGAAAKTATAAANTLESERQALQRERRTWLWLGCGALLVGTVLAVGASAYAVNQSRKQVQQNQIEAELLRAYNQADVTLCDGRLCANVDDKAARFGERKQYRRVKHR